MDDCGRRIQTLEAQLRGYKRMLYCMVAKQGGVVEIPKEEHMLVPKEVDINVRLVGGLAMRLECVPVDVKAESIGLI